MSEHAYIDAPTARELTEGRETPDRIPQVLAAAQRLADGLERLDSLTDQIERRLSPVLNPTAVDMVVREGLVEKEVDRASLAVRLEANASFLDERNRRLQLVLDRLEV